MDALLNPYEESQMTAQNMGFKVAIFSLNQWALDFTGNTQRIIESIDRANKVGSAYRAGPELELCGYSVEDAFYEQDTVFHSWSCLMDIISHSAGMNMIVDIGMPVHHGALYNCRVIVFKGKILCIRAKTSLAREGIYREYRHFTPWSNESGVTAYRLPQFVSDKLGQEYVPFGANFILELGQFNNCDTLRIGWEICQELWDIKNVSSDLYQNFGCHLVINGSASYWELRKLNTVLDMIKGISLRGGACYAFSNCVGCDGQRYVFYGRSCIFNKGQLIAMTPQLSKIFNEIQMITYTIYPREIDENRAQMGIRPDQAHSGGPVWDLLKPPKDVSQLDSSYKRFYLNAKLQTGKSSSIEESSFIPNLAIRFEQEILHYVPLWLWDYLRRSRMLGFMMPLSGGLDSSTVATLVYCLCSHLFNNLNNLQVVDYFVNIHKIPQNELSTQLSSPEDICKRILKCCYLSTKYSSQATLNRAKILCDSIGSEFSNLSLQDIYSRFRDMLCVERNNGDVTLLDQNLQARLRMTATYYLSGGNRIVLATGNVDEGIMGYFTKYDCSSADINPIGGLCKEDLKSFLKFCCAEVYKSKQQLVDILEEIIDAPPSAELTGAEQRDEDEIGVTYNEIAVLGRVRRGAYACSGPRGAFDTIWQNRNRPPFSTKIRCLTTSGLTRSLGDVAQELADLVKRFYQRYSRNRHKLTVLTPALHAETYSPDDNRFDHRHFLYAPWTEQFKSIDAAVAEIKRSGLRQ